jgi:hypothetical protein
MVWITPWKNAARPARTRLPAEEVEFTVGLFKDTLPIKNGSLTEVERIYEIILIQHAYHLTKDPASLTMETSLLFQSGKEKLNDEFFIKFVCFAERYKLVPNFTALITFMQAEVLFTQKEEREHALSSHNLKATPLKSCLKKSPLLKKLFEEITPVKKLFENINKTMMQKHFEVLRLRDHRHKYKNLDVNDRSFFTNTRTGQRFPTRGFQNGNQGRTLTLTEKFQMSSVVLRKKNRSI